MDERTFQEEAKIPEKVDQKSCNKKENRRSKRYRKTFAQNTFCRFFARNLKNRDNNVKVNSKITKLPEQAMKE
jgi:hypothetical protein